MPNHLLENDFLLRKAAEADRESIIALVSRMWGEDVSKRYAWLYLSNPHGRALTWLAIEQTTGEAVGCTSVFPRKVLVDGQQRTGSIGGDCYIDPRARRRGLATALHRLSLKEMRGYGIDFMYGPPNPHNFDALIKAGSYGVTQFRRFVRPLKGSSVYRFAFDREPSAFGSRLAGLPIRIFDRVTEVDVCGLALEEVNEFSPEFDTIFEQADKSNGVVLVRDSQYLAWHYLAGTARKQMPFAIRLNGKLIGITALEIADDHAVIVELFTVDDARMLNSALQLLLNKARMMACSSLEISCTPNHLIASRLQRSGFMGRSERGFQVAAAADDRQIGTLLNAESWNFLPADQDMDSFFSPMPV